MSDRNEMRAGVISGIAAGILVVTLSAMAFLAFDTVPPPQQMAMEASTQLANN